MGAALVLAACGGKVDGAGESAEDAGLASTSIVEPNRPVVEAWSGAAGAYVPVGGAKVCVDGHPEVACATTAADGSYVMDLPFLDGVDVDAGDPGVRTSFTATLSGYYGATKLELLDSSLVSQALPPFFLWTADSAALFASQSGSTADTTKTAFVSAGLDGTVAYGGPSNEGVQFTLTTADGQTFAPVYYNDAETTPDPSRSQCPAGVCYVMFLGVPPGPFTVTATGGAGDAGGMCPVYGGEEFLNGWPGPTRTSIEGLAVANAWAGTVTPDCP